MNADTPASPVGAGAGVLGIGVVACAACCAGPILGALSVIGIASAAGSLVAGSLAIVVGLLAAAFVVVRHRRRPAACAPPGDTVAFVEAPTLESEPAEAGAEQARGSRKLACSRPRTGATLSVRVRATRKRETGAPNSGNRADWPLWRRAWFRLGFNCC